MSRLEVPGRCECKAVIVEAGGVCSLSLADVCNEDWKAYCCSDEPVEEVSTQNSLDGCCDGLKGPVPVRCVNEAEAFSALASTQAVTVLLRGEKNIEDDTRGLSVPECLPVPVLVVAAAVNRVCPLVPVCPPCPPENP